MTCVEEHVAYRKQATTQQLHAAPCVDLVFCGSGLLRNGRGALAMSHEVDCRCGENATQAVGRWKTYVSNNPGSLCLP